MTIPEYIRIFAEETGATVKIIPDPEVDNVWGGMKFVAICVILLLLMLCGGYMILGGLR